MKDCLSCLPAGVKKVSLRSDTAGYQEDLLLYCGEGKDPRFGIIDFAIGADVTQPFRAAVLATPEREWKPLIRMVDGKPQVTDQEWAEVCHVSPTGPDTAVTALITASWRSASHFVSWPWATGRNCLSRRRHSVRKAYTNCLAR
jgi:hypothetical protein